MAKEFNIDDYKYEEEHLTYSRWAQDYRPKANHLNSSAAFGGLLYEHNDEEWGYVGWQQNQNQWTLIRKDDGSLMIKNGLAVKGRLGYFLTEIQHNSHATFIVDNVPITEMTRTACGI